MGVGMLFDTSPVKLRQLGAPAALTAMSPMMAPPCDAEWVDAHRCCRVPLRRSGAASADRDTGTRAVDASGMALR